MKWDGTGRDGSVGEGGGGEGDRFPADSFGGFVEGDDDGVVEDGGGVA